jgi:hypothetical protein
MRMIRALTLGLVAALIACSTGSIRFTPGGEPPDTVSPDAAPPDAAPPDSPPAEDCATPGDEDGNGLSDCGDPACAGTAACQAACVTGTPGCQCAVATEVSDCGAHARCEVSGPGSVCACVAAYARTGGACMFAGAPADPQMSDPTKWTPGAPGAAIDPVAPGHVDPGEAVLDRVGLCGFGGLTQTFTMPPLDRAEPMKLVVTHTAADPLLDLSGTLLSIGVGTQWVDLPLSRNVYRTDSLCLGAAAYGGPVDFRVAALGGPGCQGPLGTSVRVDQMQVQVAAAGECPAPGQVVDGSFETGTGWTFTSTQGATAAITPGIGEAGSTGALLAGANRCSEATMTGTVSLPLITATAHPAIDVFWTGTVGQRLVVGLAGKNVETLDADGVAKHARLCVPPWAAGTVTTLSFLMQRKSDNACTVALGRSFRLDNITIVDDPACSPAGELTDPGFERVANPIGPATGWGLINGYVNDTEGIAAAVVTGPGLAHTGTGALAITWINLCTFINDGGADFTAIVPPVLGTAGPAVKFFVNAPASNTMSEARVSLQPPPNVATPGFVVSPETGGYVENLLCLPPQLSRRRITLRASVGDTSGGGCLQNQPAETALFDDFEITTDPRCPAM